MKLNHSPSGNCWLNNSLFLCDLLRYDQVGAESRLVPPSLWIEKQIPDILFTYRFLSFVLLILYLSWVSACQGQRSYHFFFLPLLSSLVLSTFSSLPNIKSSTRLWFSLPLPPASDLYNLHLRLRFLSCLCLSPPRKPILCLFLDTLVSHSLQDLVHLQMTLLFKCSFIRLW